MVRLRLLALVALSIYPALSRAIPSFTGLGDLAGGSYYSFAGAISGDGTTVVGSSYSESGLEAFRWTNIDGMVGLGDLAGGTFDSRGQAVSHDGSVIVGVASGPSAHEAMRWTAQDGIQTIGVLLGDADSNAQDVSLDGSVIVGWSFDGASKTEAFRWTVNQGMTGLGAIDGGGFPTSATGVSADGSIVVGRATPPFASSAAFHWNQADGMEELPAPPSDGSSFANGVSSDGSVVVGGTFPFDGGASEAWMWTASGGTIGLGDLPGDPFESIALAVSGDGSVVVGAGHPGDRLQAMIWDSSNGIRELDQVLMNEFGLDLAGWTLDRAVGISDDGLTIVGWGSNPDGETEAWIAIIPEPSAGLLLGCGLIGIGLRARAQRPPRFVVRLLSAFL